ncbi:MAG: DUF1818 family protein [Cyanobacteria bacterium]|nr:DUF1818 family protein [Cyanobacteriota bacterium]
MEVREGSGWRLVVDSDRHPFGVLIGGGDAAAGAWAAEFSLAEALALRRGVAILLQQHQALLATLMAEEAIELAMEVACEGGDLWLCLEGDRNSWCLRFVLTPAPGRRGVEGSWGREASVALAAALQSCLPSEAEDASHHGGDIAA